MTAGSAWAIVWLLQKWWLEMLSETPEELGVPDLYDKIAAQDPLSLRNKYLTSSIYQDFLAPRLSTSANI